MNDKTTITREINGETIQIELTRSEIANVREYLDILDGQAILESVCCDCFNDAVYEEIINNEQLALDLNDSVQMTIRGDTECEITQEVLLDYGYDLENPDQTCQNVQKITSMEEIEH